MFSWVAFVTGICKGIDSLLVVKRAGERVAFAHSEIAPEGRAGFRHPDDDHVVLCVHGVSDALSDGSVPVDGDVDGHEVPRMVLFIARP